MKIYLTRITFQEFEKSLYKYYKKMFPKKERRSLENIKKTYNSKHEQIYKIRLDDNTPIGFFMLEKLPECPYYLDYYTIFKKYQDKGVGSAVMRAILDKICGDSGVCADIEKVNLRKKQSMKRWEFYKKVGFRLVNSELEVYYVSYNPIIYSQEKFTTREVVRTLFKYYRLNSEEGAFSKYCKIKFEGED